MNDSGYIISSDDLYDQIEQDTSNSKYKIAAELLLEAINDWPTSGRSEPKEFLSDLIAEIGLPLSFERLEKYLKNLNPNTSGWKMESTTSLLELFKYDKTKTLDTIINEISDYYKPH